MLQKTIPFSKAPQTEEEKRDNIITFIITTGVLDRDFEIYETKSMDITPFAETGSVTLFHLHNKFPIGVPVKITATENEIRCSVKFDVGEADDAERTAEVAYNKVLSGSLINCSVEVFPTPNTIVDIIEEPVGERPYYLVYRNLALSAFSLVITPANPDARAVNTNRPRCEVVDLRRNDYEQIERDLQELSG